MTEAMGSCSSKPGEVGAMPQQGSGSAATVDPQAIEAVRASANALHPKPATPERPVSPGYDRRVVSHDASKKPPAARAIVPEPFGFDEPVAPEPRELPPTPVAPRAARVDDDARPPRLDVEDARPAPLGEIPPGTTDAGAESRTTTISAREPRAAGPSPSNARASSTPTHPRPPTRTRRRAPTAGQRRSRPAPAAAATAGVCDGLTGSGRRPHVQRRRHRLDGPRQRVFQRTPDASRESPETPPRRDDDDVPAREPRVCLPAREPRVCLPAVHARRRRRSREDAASHRRGGDGRDVWTRRDAAGASAPRRSGTRCGPRASFGRFRRRAGGDARDGARAREVRRGHRIRRRGGSLRGRRAARGANGRRARARRDVVVDDGRDVASCGVAASRGGRRMTSFARTRARTVGRSTSIRGRG